jgi:transposase
MNCPKCKVDRFVKNGIVGARQRYKCKGCGCNFTQDHKHGYPVKDKVLAVILHLSGMSMNAIAPIIGVSTQSVMRWIKVYGDQTPMPSVGGGPVEVEIDEMHHFLLKKMKNSGSGKCWIIELGPSWAGFVAIVIRQPDKN